MPRRWSPHASGERAATVSELLPQLDGLGRAFWADASGALLQLAAAVHQLYPLLAATNGSAIVPDERSACAWARQLAGGLPVDGEPSIPVDDIHSALDEVNATAVALRQYVEAIDISPILAHAQAILDASRDFAPSRFLRPMELLNAANETLDVTTRGRARVRAAEPALLRLRQIPTQMVHLNQMRHTRLRVVSEFLSNTTQMLRAQRRANASAVLAQLQVWLVPRQTSHPLYRVRSFVELDMMWSQLWSAARTASTHRLR